MSEVQGQVCTAEQLSFTVICALLQVSIPGGFACSALLRWENLFSKRWAAWLQAVIELIPF
jgi:hypothetical protein